eukprot:scaffold8433_cov173-Skeletonema_marinoi.AAC.1
MGLLTNFVNLPIGRVASRECMAPLMTRHRSSIVDHASCGGTILLTTRTQIIGHILGRRVIC